MSGRFISFRYRSPFLGRLMGWFAIATLFGLLAGWALSIRSGCSLQSTTCSGCGIWTVDVRPCAMGGARGAAFEPIELVDAIPRASRTFCDRRSARFRCRIRAAQPIRGDNGTPRTSLGSWLLLLSQRPISMGGFRGLPDSNSNVLEFQLAGTATANHKVAVSEKMETYATNALLISLGILPPKNPERHGLHQPHNARGVRERREKAIRCHLSSSGCKPM